MTRRPSRTPPQRPTRGCRTEPSPTSAPRPTKTNAWIRTPAPTIAPGSMTANGPTLAVGSRRASGATAADGETPGVAGASGWNSVRRSISVCCGAPTRSIGAGKPDASGPTRKAPARDRFAAAAYRGSVRNEIWSGPAASSAATPVTVRAGSPSSVAWSAAASSPSVNPAALAIGAALLLALRRGLLVVRADHLFRQIGLRRGVQHRGAALFDDEVVAALLADLVDHAGQVLKDTLEQARLFLLELLLEVVGEPGGVPALALELILLLAPGIGRHQRALLLELVPQRLELLALRVHLALHPGLFALQLLAGRDAGRGARQHPLNVDEPDSGRRGWRLGQRRLTDRREADGRDGECANPCPHAILLEGRADGEVERADVFSSSPVEVQAVVHADRAERRLPSDAAAGGLPQVRQVEVRAEPVDVADVEEPGEPEPERQRDDVLRVPQDLGGAADPEPACVARRNLAEFEAPDRVRATEIESLEDRQRLVRPAEPVAGLHPPRQDVAEPDRLGVRGEADGLHVTGIAAEAREFHREVGLPALRRRHDDVPTVAHEAPRHGRRQANPFLLQDLDRRRAFHVADVVTRDAVPEIPPPELGERVAEPQTRAQRLVLVLDEVTLRLVEVEPRRERPVEQPRLGETDHPLPADAARADAERRLPATTEEVPLREVDRADEAVHRGVAAAEAEDPGGALGDVHVDDDLGLVGPGLRGHLHLLEISQVHEPLARAVLLLQRVQVAFVERDLAMQDLVLAPGFARDVDPLDEHLGSLGDLEADVQNVPGWRLVDPGDDVGGGPADRAVEVLDAPPGVTDARQRVHVTRLEADLPLDLVLR